MCSTWLDTHTYEYNGNYYQQYNLVVISSRILADDT